jgi:hypothetical protein
MNNSQDIRLVLTLAETNQILHALGSLPFREVYQLVNKIQTQAEMQLHELPPNHQVEDVGESNNDVISNLTNSTHTYKYSDSG